MATADTARFAVAVPVRACSRVIWRAAAVPGAEVFGAGIPGEEAVQAVAACTPLRCVQYRNWPVSRLSTSPRLSKRSFSTSRSCSLI
jgi:hypothetical protein